MQLRKTVWMLTALSALSLAMTACDGEGTDETSCASNTECATGEVCHPSAKVCVATCTSGSDCPAEEKTCAPFGTNGPSVCQCATDQICAQNAGDGFICSNLDKRCVEKCTADTDCGTGRTCNEGTGQCEQGTTGPTTCTGEGRSTCAYGQFCSSGTCTAVPAPTCANFNPAQGGKQPVWTTSSTGPIIYEVTQVSYGTDSFCSGAGDITAKARVKAYTTGTFPTDKDDLNGLFYVRVNGTEVSGKSLVLQSGYSVSSDGKSATFTMNFCPGASSTTLSIGLYFTGGNEVCAQLSR